MEILLYILIGLFSLDIIVGIIDGVIEGRRSYWFDKRLWWIEQRLDEDIFPEFKDDGK